MNDATGHDILDVQVGPDDPATDVSVQTLRSGLESEDNGVRLQAASVASFVPREEIETLEAVTPQLLDLLDDEKGVIVNQATIALAIVAEESPELLEDGVPRLVELLVHDHSHVRAMAAKALGHVVVDHPEYFTDLIDPLVAAAVTPPTDAVDVDKLDDPSIERSQRETLLGLNHEEATRQQYAREITANLLVEIADHDPAAVAPHASDLLVLVEEGNVPLRTSTADVIARVAREDPEAVADAVDPLCGLLDHDDESLVATVVSALGFIGDPAAVEPLRDLAADERRNEDLRDMASETADFLEN